MQDREQPEAAERAPSEERRGVPYGTTRREPAREPEPQMTGNTAHRPEEFSPDDFE